MATVEDLTNDVEALVRVLCIDARPATREVATALANTTKELVKILDAMTLDRGRSSGVEARLTDIVRDVQEALRAGGRKRQRILAAAISSLQEMIRDLSDRESSVSRERHQALLESEVGLRRAAELYERDAKRDSRAALLLAFTSLFGIALATTLAIHQSSTITRDLPVTSPRTVLALGPVFAIYACSAVGIMQAGRLRRGSDEIRRLHRQILTLTSYLSPLPRETQDLLRACLTQRLFPRLISDDPLREEDWFPEGDSVLASIMPHLAQELLAPDDEED